MTEMEKFVVELMIQVFTMTILRDISMVTLTLWWNIKPKDTANFMEIKHYCPIKV